MFRPLLWTVSTAFAFGEWGPNPCDFIHVDNPCIITCEMLQGTAISNCKANDDSSDGDCHTEGNETICCKHIWDTDNTCHETNDCPDYAYGQCRCIAVDEDGIPIVQPM